MAMTQETLAFRMTRLSAGICQSGMTENGTTITVWPRDEKTGLYEVTAHPHGGAREQLHATGDIEEALLLAEREVLRRDGRLIES